MIATRKPDITSVIIEISSWKRVASSSIRDINPPFKLCRTTLLLEDIARVDEAPEKDPSQDYKEGEIAPSNVKRADKCYIFLKDGTRLGTIQGYTEIMEKWTSYLQRKSRRESRGRL